MKKVIFILCLALGLNASDGIDPNVAAKLKAYSETLKKSANSNEKTSGMSRQEKELLESAKLQLKAYRNVVYGLLKQFPKKQVINDDRILISSSGGLTYATIDDVTKRELCDNLSLVKKTNRELKLYSDLLYSFRESENANSIISIVSETKVRINNLFTQALPATDMAIDVSNYYDLKKGSDICPQVKITKISNSGIEVKF